ncbi:MAG: PQQ-dependent sugar dehydrogenase, partial [Acidimicrobiales bacterium]
MRGLTSRVGLLVALGVVASVIAVGAPAGAANPVVAPIVDRGVTLEVEPWVRLPDSGAGRPRLNAIAVAGDRLFVVEEFDGLIHEISTESDNRSSSVFFDVKSAIAAATDRSLDNANLVHGGLRGVAFHPDFATNGRFYTSVMETRPTTPDPADYLSDALSPIAADSVLIEWTHDHGTGQTSASTYRQVFRVGMPVYDHPIKQIAFNPFAPPGDSDHGILYVAHGDGSVLSATAGGGQNNDALGKILRIDPLPDGGAPFRIPPDNPFVGDPEMSDEVWSLGHRNPHHLAFGRDSTGEVHLIVAEAGRDNVEEVNLIDRGGDYGWSEREGTFVHLPSGDLFDGIAPLPADDAQNGYTYPAAQLGHDGEPGDMFTGEAIAGGFVVDNGSGLSGRYFYSDFPRSGRVFESAVDELA